MRHLLIIFILIFPSFLFGQKKRNSIDKPELWASAGIMPLEKGAAIYGKTRLNLFNYLGANLIFGYGFANPERNYDKLSNIKSRGIFFSGGMVYKTKDMVRNKHRKLNLNLTVSFVIGKGKESAKYNFTGIDFDNYTSSETYKQKYDFNNFQLSIGATYRIKEKYNIELGVYAINSPQKNIQGNQYFNMYGNYAYSYTGSVGMNVGFGYLLWTAKSKNTK